MLHDGSHVVKFGANVALTIVGALRVGVQGPLPLQAPPQPVKTQPAAGAGFSVTLVPVSNEAEHVGAQEMPAGLDVTEPEPLVVTVSCVFGWIKFAVIVVSAPSVTAQEPVPVHVAAPLHPVNVKPFAATALRTTVLPPANVALHVAPQSIPAGSDVTVPLPLRTTSSFTGGSVATSKLLETSNDASWPVPASTTPSGSDEHATTKTPSAMLVAAERTEARRARVTRAP